MESVDIRELRMLERMLTRAGIPHRFTDMPGIGGAMISVPDERRARRFEPGSATAVQSALQLGGPEAMIEAWIMDAGDGKLRYEDKLSAEEAFERIEKAWKGVRR